MHRLNIIVDECWRMRPEYHLPGMHIVRVNTHLARQMYNMVTMALADLNGCCSLLPATGIRNTPGNGQSPFKHARSAHTLRGSNFGAASRPTTVNNVRKLAHTSSHLNTT
jgi:hypothetical protein